MNPGMMDKKIVERLCEKSKRLSGAKWKWRRICEKHNLTWQEVEAKYDIIIKQREDAIEKYKLATAAKLKDNDGEGSTTGTKGTKDE